MCIRDSIPLVGIVREENRRHRHILKHIVFNQHLAPLRAEDAARGAVSYTHLRIPTSSIYGRARWHGPIAQTTTAFRLFFTVDIKMQSAFCLLYTSILLSHSIQVE